jgi:1-acyl-sn-glycerol-3-phosphate acyltransferase
MRDASLLEPRSPLALPATAPITTPLRTRFARSLVHGVDRLGELLRIEIAGIERLPPGRAVLVTNHAFGFDAAFLIARLRALTGRNVWALGEHAWWRVPLARDLARAMGTVDGTPANADRLLSEDQLVLVLPGGLREAMKPRELRYRLLWGERYGFVRAALRNRAPIVPIASLGADDMFDLVGNAFARSRHLHLPFPLPRLAHVPHLRPLRYVIGEPIEVDASVAEADERRVRRLRREVEGTLHEIFEESLARKLGFFGRG